MSENDAVLNAFSEWWALHGSRIADARNGGTVEPEAFAAGAEWQRERDTEAATFVHNHHRETAEGYNSQGQHNSALFEYERAETAFHIAERIRKGDA